MKFTRVDYRKLSGKQQEIFNFQKVAGVLADYGFNCIKLADDWIGADFLAYHNDGVETLKVQLKGRLTIDRKYLGKGLHIAFPLDDGWCLVEHDELINIIGRFTNWLNTSSWTEEGQYHTSKPSKALIEALKPHTLGRFHMIGQLFIEEPLQWGLRGDPYLWKEMQIQLISTPIPSNLSTLDEYLEQAFKKITGHSLFCTDDFYLEQFAHDGMSSGMISPSFWRESAIPLLRSRYTSE